MVLAASTRLARRRPRRPLLHRHLGWHALLRLRPQQEPLLADADLRHRPRRAPVVPDALGRLGHRPVRPLGRRAHGLSDRGPLSLALARHAGFAAECWIWHDHAVYSDEVPYLVCAHCGAGSGLDGDDCGTRICAGSVGSGTGVS